MPQLLSGNGQAPLVAAITVCPEIPGTRSMAGKRLTRRRVVVLAEPGAGNTTELEEQARQLRERGDFAFFATLQNIG